MNFQNFEKTDRRILGTAILLLFLSLMLLWQDNWIYRLAQSKRVNLEEIGKVHISNNDVRRRHEIALSWLPLRKSNEVFQGDSIFTGDNSTATITTKSGEEISIAANSLVVINQRTDSISLNIGFGSVEGRVEKGKKFIISSNNNITELDGDNARIKVDAGEGNKLVLNVIAGEIRVRSADGDKILKRDDSTEISPDGSTVDPLKPRIQILSPLADQRFKTTEDRPILFRWQTAQKFSRMKIKVALDEAMQNTVVDTRINDNQYSAYNLPKDTTLYWQVLAEGGLSKVTKFIVVGNRPPIPVFPTPGTQFFYDPFLTGPEAGASVELSWEQGSPASHFEIQVAGTANFSDNPIPLKTRDKKLKLPFLAKGVYFWRVRSIDFPNESWSAASTFKVGPEPTRVLAPPIPQLADSQFLIETKVHSLTAERIHSLRKRGAQSYIAKYPMLRWSKVAGADRYTLQISRNRQFTDIIVSETLPRTSFTWRNIEPGTYYWRAKGLSENFKDGLYTAVQQLQINLAPPQQLSQALIVDEVPDQLLLTAAPPPLLLKWNPTIFTKNYEVEFSNQSNFTNSTRFITSQNERRVQVPRPGIYYWRIRGLDSGKLPVSPFSSAYTLEFQRVFKDPMAVRNLAAVYPRQQDSIILVGQKTSELEFKWSKPYESAKYRIELSYDPSFEFVFYTAETNTNFYKYTQPFQARVIYWRVRAEGQDFVSDWTGGNRFLVAYENIPFDFDSSDTVFDARLKAKDRQEKLLAAQARQLARLRTPASALEIQLDTPQLIAPIESHLIESNLDPNLTPAQLAKQPFEKFYSQVRNFPTLRWTKVPAAERYVIEIAKDPQFRQVVTKTPAWDPYLSWDTVRPGRFYYRVQAFNDRYKRSNYSRIQRIDVTVVSPIPTSTDNFVEVFDEPRDMWMPPSPFKLSWTPVVFARGYEVEFSEDKSFKLTKVFRTPTPETEFRVSKSGLYFWRVRPISENGIGIGEFSPVRSIEVIQTNRQPASVAQLTGLFPKERTMLFVGRGLMNLAFHWVSPDPEQTYQLELSTTASFDTVLASIKSRRNQAVIKKDLPEGTIYWRVRSGNKASPVQEFDLRREASPYVPQPSISDSP